MIYKTEESAGRDVFFFKANVCFVLNEMKLRRQWWCPPLPPPGLTGNAPGTGWDGPGQPLIHQPLSLSAWLHNIRMKQSVSACHIRPAGFKHSRP